MEITWRYIIICIICDRVFWGQVGTELPSELPVPEWGEVQQSDRRMQLPVRIHGELHARIEFHVWFMFFIPISIQLNSFKCIFLLYLSISIFLLIMMFLQATRRSFTPLFLLIFIFIHLLYPNIIALPGPHVWGPVPAGEVRQGLRRDVQLPQRRSVPPCHWEVGVVTYPLSIVV